MAEKKNILTYEGLKKLEDELQDLKVVQRREIAQKIKEAREQGDLKENAEYDAAKDEQRDIEARIEQIEKILKNAEVVLDEEIDIKDSAEHSDLPVEDGSIEFDDVCFSYSNNEENLTLSHINLDIQPGEMVGIIGGTGSAKTTLVQLIPRLYDVMSGSVRIGGRDVREYSLKNLRSSVAMVLQKNVLFSGSIRENLKWGNPNATDEQIIEACKVASAHDFITSFPEGYDTDLGQGGVNVSGGQKQRLCIARALLCNPKVIIMDDSTSAVDTATDSQIRSALREKLAGTTTIIIAQRITSVSDADKIIVMHEGEIVDIGTHEQLLARNEIYQDLYHSQQKGVA